MRKPASAILLIILLFNMVGYRAWFYYAEQKADAAMEASLNQDQYNDKDLVAITVPLNNPYLLDTKTFERVDGEIMYQGKMMKYVKRNVANGRLTLLCIADTPKMVLTKAKAQYGNLANEPAGSSNGGSKSGMQKSFSSGDYESQEIFSATAYFQSADLSVSSLFLTQLKAGHVCPSGKPPELIC